MEPTALRGLTLKMIVKVMLTGTLYLTHLHGQPPTYELGPLRLTTSNRPPPMPHRALLPHLFQLSSPTEIRVVPTSAGNFKGAHAYAGKVAGMCMSRKLTTSPAHGIHRVPPAPHMASTAVRILCLSPPHSPHRTGN